MVFLPMRITLSGRSACAWKRLLCCCWRVVRNTHLAFVVHRCIKRSDQRPAPPPAIPETPHGSAALIPQTHRADVGELLRAHIVGTDEEGLLVGVEVLAEAGVVLFFLVWWSWGSV